MSDRQQTGSFEIRRATVADLASIIEFNQAMAVETESRSLDSATLTAGVETILQDASRGRYYLATSEGRIAGQTMITFEWSDWRNGWFWWIQSVYVHPDYRRQGVFRAIHDCIEREARSESDVIGLRLYVDTDNTVAKSTYPQLSIHPTQYLLYEHDWSGQPSPH